MFRALPLSAFLFVCVSILSQQQGIVFGLLHSSSTARLFLHSRQLMPVGDIPPECQAPCQSFTDITDVCAGGTVNVNCLCSDTAANAILTCVNCIASMSAPNSGFRSSEQQRLDDLSSACQEAGFPFNETLQLAPASSGVSKTLQPISSSYLLSLILLLIYFTRS